MTMKKKLLTSVLVATLTLTSFNPAQARMADRVLESVQTVAYRTRVLGHNLQAAFEDDGVFATAARHFGVAQPEQEGLLGVIERQRQRLLRGYNTLGAALVNGAGSLVNLATRPFLDWRVRRRVVNEVQRFVKDGVDFVRRWLF